MEDEHGDGGGRREGLGDQHELLGRGEGGRQQRGQILHRDVGWQGRGEGQHGRHDAVCEQAFLFGTEKTQTHAHICLSYAFKFAEKNNDFLRVVSR